VLASSKTVRPASLKRGDVVGIAAPAGPVEKEAFERGCDRLRELGYKPVYSQSIFNRELFFAGGVRRRLDELHELIRTPQIKAIICARGGYGSNYLLERVDLELVKANPKIIFGYSDITSLQSFIYSQTGLITFHGPMLTKDFSKPDGIHLNSFASATTGESRWQINSADSPGLEPLKAGTGEGVLFGGCLSLLVASLGTPFEIQTDDTLLFVEDLGERPYQLDRMLMHLRLAGKLKKVRGIIFGEMLDCAPPKDADYTLKQVLQRAVSDLDIPIAFGLRSGHVSSGNITLPIGVQARLTVSDEITLEILESATTLISDTTNAGLQ
jgi:muramoyltetrapeptide carboxypeptidase